MKKTNLLVLPLAFVMLEASTQVFAQAQAQPELDITITVLEEGESPAGFIQQLALPPAEFFGNDEETTTAVDVGTDDIGAEVAGDAAADVAEVAGAATETVTNTVSETISIDGTAAAVAESGLVPAAIVEVLDENLPLVNSLEDVINETAEGLVNGGLPGTGVLPTVPDLVPGIALPVVQTGLVPSTVTDVLADDLPLVDSLDGVLTQPTEGAAEIVDNLGVDTENLLPALDGTVGELSNTTDGLDEITAPATDLLPANMTPDTGGLPEVTDDAAEAVEDLVGENPEAPVADTLEDVTRNLPDVLR
jgi:hypothetical protein